MGASPRLPHGFARAPLQLPTALLAGCAKASQWQARQEWAYSSPVITWAP